MSPAGCTHQVTLVHATRAALADKNDIQLGTDDAAFQKQQTSCFSVKMQQARVKPFFFATAAHNQLYNAQAP